MNAAALRNILRDTAPALAADLDAYDVAAEAAAEALAAHHEAEAALADAEWAVIGAPGDLDARRAYVIASDRAGRAYGRRQATREARRVMLRRVQAHRVAEQAASGDVG